MIRNTNFPNISKKELRSVMKARRLALSKEEQTRHADSVKEKLLAMLEYKEATCIYGYLATQGEVSVTRVLEQALLDGKRVALPRVSGKEMNFYYVTDIEKDTNVGNFSILEPKMSCEMAEDSTALILVPGVAFSPAGARLGYGGGFYDRFLAKEPNHFLTVGVCYDFQVVAELPQEPHDILLHTILPSSIT